MAYSQYSNVTDELLSAYIDGVVTAAERALVEEAAANDQRIAWRLDSLRQTVNLLGQLSDVPLPRSFTLNETLLAESTAGSMTAQATGRRKTPTSTTEPAESGSFWERLRRFWGSGNLVWRNAAAVCALLLLIVLIGDGLYSQPDSAQQSAFPSSETVSSSASTSEIKAGEIASGNGPEAEAAEVAMARAAAALDVAASDDAAPDAPVTADVSAPLDGSADAAETEDKYSFERAEVARGLASEDGLLSSQARVAPLSSPKNAAALMASSDGAVTPSASVAVTTAVMQTDAIAAAMIAPQTIITTEVSAPESPIVLDMTSTRQYAGSVAPAAADAAQPASLETQAVAARAEVQAAPQTPAPPLPEEPTSEESTSKVATAVSLPTATPAAIALAESDADQESAASEPAAALSRPEAMTDASTSADTASSSIWQSAAIAGPIVLLLLLLLFLILWLRSRTKSAA